MKQTERDELLKQTERDELLIRIDERTHNIEKDIKQIKKTIYGNGKEGICDTVMRHKTYFYLIGSTILIISGIVGYILDKIF